MSASSWGGEGACSAAATFSVGSPSGGRGCGVDIVLSVRQGLLLDTLDARTPWGFRLNNLRIGSIDVLIGSAPLQLNSETCDAKFLKSGLALAELTAASTTLQFQSGNLITAGSCECFGHKQFEAVDHF